MNPLIMKRKIINTIDELPNTSLDRLYDIVYSFKIEIEHSSDPQKKENPINNVEANTQLQKMSEQLCTTPLKKIHINEEALLSEASLAEDWNRPEEDEAWAHLQKDQ